MKSKIKIAVIALLALLLSTLTMVATSSPVAADTQPAVSVLTVDQQHVTDRQGNQYILLVAKLHRADGYPLSERTVNFYETVDLFGTARIPLGSAVTSAVGEADLKYATRLAGPHTFTAIYSGDATTQLVMVDATLDMENLPPMQPLSPPTGMEVIGKYTLPFVGLVVLAVWGLILGTMIFVFRGIRSPVKRGS